MQPHAFEFPLKGDSPLDRDNGYQFLSGLSKPFPFLHGRQEIQIAPVRGTRTEDSKGILLDRGSRLHIRGLSFEQALEMGHSKIRVGGVSVLLGEPSVRFLEASPKLVSRLVVVKGGLEYLDFIKLFGERIPWAAYEIGGRKTLSIKGFTTVGYTVVLHELTPEQSLQVQMTGVGSHTSMGCGVFYPAK